MNKPVSIGQFQGMNNVRQQDGDLRQPHVILNADPSPEGALRRRKGLRLVAPLPDAHSLWACKSFLLCMSQGGLYCLDASSTPTLVTQVPGDASRQMFYAMVGDDVYLSNGDGFQAIYRDNAVRPWTADRVTVAPDCLLVDGNMKAGLYRACFVPVGADGAFHAPGPWSDWDIPAGRGLMTINRPAGMRLCLTDPDGHVFYVQNADLVVANENHSPLPTFGCIPYPAATMLRVAFGRMWGVVAGNRLVYSEPYRFDLAKRTNHMEFREPVTMVMPVEQGLYVGTDSVVYFLRGTNPAEMTMADVSSAGAIPGQQVYASHIPELGSKVPVWGSRDGVMVGSHGGQVVPLTRGVVKIPPGQACAVAETPGQPFQILAAMRRSDSDQMGVGDHVTAEVVRNGKLI